MIKGGEIDSLSAKFFGEQFGTFATAVGNDEIANTFGLEVDECFFGHFAGADDEDEFVVEAAEDAAGEIADGDAGDGDASICECRFGADLSRDFECSLEEHIGEWAAGGVFLGDAVGFLHLVDDLWFTQNHAVDAAGDVEEVPDGLGACVGDQRGREVVGGKVVETAEEIDDVVDGDSA